ncbi:response regulator [Vibrio aestuarianus]|uniref:Response regulator n=1 Tax=Vibrio aestuarianus TaxID=28171 RepID=A0A9X4F5Q3_9VIBR|nr:response regulator [Vibrio aestuarianus]MDE1234773.1 response regulator [Vibrio aestuarianus]MDE1245586.1 response regulator [Vibrio aestuarianus]MDE1345558.1 response regulator [Vibrio aestuarianus]NGZ62844.1 response regulator [Vibrio aestuarianus subsp. cardii]NGZ66435.1 response regulator [Vibrio aestuarianus subsp. cardii]
MNKFLILCVDDEREVLDSVMQDLDCFEEYFIVEAAESVTEAKDVIAENQAQHIKLALILCDHIMPEQTGISFLIELSQNEETAQTRKVLLTGQAGLEDTVEAVNHSSLHFYVAKPWNGDKLREIIKDQLTQYMIANESELMPWARVLDAEKIFNSIAENRINFGE